MIIAAKSHAEKRGRINRNDLRHVYSITKDSMVKQVLNQHGRCVITGIDLKWQRNTDFAASLERENYRGGYTDENCVFIITEFNTSCYLTENSSLDDDTNWTKAKFEFVLPFLRRKYQPNQPDNKATDEYFEKEEEE